MSARYLGMRAGDLEGKPFAEFWQPAMAPLAPHAVDAIARSPIAATLLPPLDRAPELLDDSIAAIEDGFALEPSGALHVAIRTDFPGAAPAMIDWWFGWHGSEAQRYKLWHPRAHVHAAWRGADRPDARGRERYVGRTSCVDEYVGSTLGRYAIRFVPPRELGLDEAKLDRDVATAVCARVGFAEVPFDSGWLVHHVRRTARGAEMRSRFWIGGPHAAARGGGLAGHALAAIARRMRRPSEREGRALLVHCAEEMAHLASFLPRIHAELHDAE